MMKVTVKDKDSITTYMVRFYYPHSRRHLRNQSIVYCYISTKINGKLEVIAAGCARCISSDTFNKQVGRKYSFSKAVNMFKDRNIRKLFWNEYLRTIKLPGHTGVIKV